MKHLSLEWPPMPPMLPRTGPRPTPRSRARAPRLTGRSWPKLRRDEVLEAVDLHFFLSDYTPKAEFRDPQGPLSDRCTPR